MAKAYYSGQYVMRRTGRKSPNAFGQLVSHMPRPDAIIAAAERPTRAWSLKKWEEFAHTRKNPLKRDLLAAVEELRAEERALIKNWGKAGAPPKAATVAELLDQPQNV